jgi:anaerobic magnesium-protoporphyrin IX monomethyl ester cyclase
MKSAPEGRRFPGYVDAPREDSGFAELASRPLKFLFVQLGFHPDYPDVATLATTYNDGIYYVASFLGRELPAAEVHMCQMFWGEHPRDFPLETYDYILISALATHFWSNRDALRLIKERRGDHCKTIMGGPHASFAPHEALTFVDYVILGEGEVPALQLVAALELEGDLSEVDNLCFLDDQGILVIPKVSRFNSLENAIDPRLLARAPRLHWATVSMSRGCPFDCSFCYAIRLLGRRFRTKAVGSIVEELDGIHQQTGCPRFYVTDLNFATREDFCRSVAESVRDRPYSFIAMTRIELADNLDLLLDLKRSGFNEYCLGVESEDPGTLKAFNKRVNASLQTERLWRFAEQDIYIHSAIIFGLETQDLGSIHRTARWCADARIVHPTFVCLAEYPFQNLLFGSHQDIEDHRIIMDVPTYQHYSFVGIFPRHMRPSVLQRAIIECYEIFFDRALEIESRPQRRMRLKSYALSVEHGLPGMERHVHFLEQLEKPYYTENGTLKEHLLEADFAGRKGELRDWLATAVHRDPNFAKALSL